MTEMPKNEWQDMVDELKAGQGGGRFFFLKPGRTRIRLVPVPGTENETRPTFFQPTEGNYQGKVNKRQILLAIIVGAEGREIPDEDKNKVQPLLVAPTVVTQIVETLAEGWDLLSPKGHGVSIVRSGQGLQTTYKVTPSPTPIPLPEPIVYIDSTMAELDAEYRAQDADKSTPATSPASSAPVADSAPVSTETDAGW